MRVYTYLFSRGIKNVRLSINIYFYSLVNSQISNRIKCYFKIRNIATGLPSNADKLFSPRQMTNQINRTLNTFSNIVV